MRVDTSFWVESLLLCSALALGTPAQLLGWFAPPRSRKSRSIKMVRRGPKRKKPRVDPNGTRRMDIDTYDDYGNGGEETPPGPVSAGDAVNVSEDEGRRSLEEEGVEDGEDEEDVRVASRASSRAKCLSGRGVGGGSGGGGGGRCGSAFGCQVLCPKCLEPLLPHDRRYRTTRMHYECGLQDKQAVYAVTSAGGAPLAQAYKAMQSEEPEKYRQAMKAIKDDPAHGKEIIVKAVQGFFKKRQLETEKAGEMLDEVEWSRRMRQRRGGKLKEWKEEFWRRVDAGEYTEEDEETGAVLLQMKKAKTYIDREVIGNSSNDRAAAANALKSGAYGSSMFAGSRDAILGKGASRGTKRRPPSDDEEEEDSEEETEEEDEDEDEVEMHAIQRLAKSHQARRAPTRVPSQSPPATQPSSKRELDGLHSNRRRRDRSSSPLPNNIDGARNRGGRTDQRNQNRRGQSSGASGGRSKPSTASYFLGKAVLIVPALRSLMLTWHPN